MGMADRILKWILGEIKLPKHVIIEHINEMDTDKDECVSILELVQFLRKYYKELSE